MIALVVLLSFSATLTCYWLSVRAAYRYMITHEPWVILTDRCECGLHSSHRGNTCHPVDPVKTRQVRLACSLLGLLYFTPMVWNVARNGAEFAITWKQPLSLTEKKEKEKADKERAVQLKRELLNAEAELARVTAELEAAKNA